MNQRRTYRVKEVARISGISVRALHHYDEVGLLVPALRSRAGYRLYDDQDLLRLQQILLGREFGLSLEEIRRSLDDPRFNQKEALLQQKEELEKRARHTAEMLRAVEQAIFLLDHPQEQEAIQMKEIFEGFDAAKYEQEAKEKWGTTDAYQISAKRTQSYSADDWKRFKAEQNAIYEEMFGVLRAGKKPDDPAALALVERHRLLIDRWFFPCDQAMHRRLADGYEADSRFAENIDRFGEGLTAFLVVAIRADTSH